MSEVNLVLPQRDNHVLIEAAKVINPDDAESVRHSKTLYVMLQYGRRKVDHLMNGNLTKTLGDNMTRHFIISVHMIIKVHRRIDPSPRSQHHTPHDLRRLIQHLPGYVEI